MDNKYSGTKGVNHDKNFRNRHLKLLSTLIESILGTNGTPLPGGIATEATLLQVLAKEDTEFQMQYLKDANDLLVWVEVDIVDGVKTYVYYDSPGGNIIVPVQPLKPLSLVATDTELIEDEFIAVVADVPNGYSLGDIISKISYFDLSNASPVLINSFWYNKTTSSILTTVDILDLEDQDGPILSTPGSVGDVITVDGTTSLIFDADSVLIENDSDGDITVSLSGILGNDYTVLQNTSKAITIDVPHITDVVIAGIGTGNVYLTYSRRK